MSLAKQIIYGQDNEVAATVAFGAPLNEIDEYGYTPLVETAIVNSVNKAKILLKAGAEVDFPDLTGRTALHWAAENGNTELCRLLLSHQANPNAYTLAGQPVLALPLLKRLNTVKQLLTQYGASIQFAQDFINTKLLGHRFELEGRVDLVDTKGTFFEIEFEGFYLQFSLAMAIDSLRDFKNNFGGKHLKQHFNKLTIIIDSLKNAAQLLTYQHYLVNKQQYANQIDNLLKSSPLVIPLSYAGHAVCFIKYGDRLIRCDRGEFGRDNGTVIIYRVGQRQRLTRPYIQSLLYQRQEKSFIDNGLAKTLELEPITYLPLSTQITGNCSWANVEAVIPAIMYLLNLDEQRRNAVINMEACRDEALAFYEEWINWDRRRALHFCIDSFMEADPARKASKAAILAAILFQKLKYQQPEHHSAAEKIIKILTENHYLYILQSYIKVFSVEKGNPLYDNLLEFLDYYGIDLEKIRQ